jgi:hypothetical protein
MNEMALTSPLGGVVREEPWDQGSASVSEEQVEIAVSVEALVSLVLDLEALGVEPCPDLPAIGIVVIATRDRTDIFAPDGGWAAAPGRVLGHLFACPEGRINSGDRWIRA